MRIQAARISRRIGTLALLLLAALGTGAVQRIELYVADIAGPAWRAEDITLKVTLDENARPAGTLSVGRLALGAPIGTLTDVAVECPHLRIHADGLACDGGEVQVQTPAMGKRKLPVSLHLAYDGRALDLTLPRALLTFNSTDGTRAAERLEIAVDLALRADDNGWRFDAAVELRGGQGYFEPVFVDFGARPASLRVSGTWAGETLRLTRARLDQPGVLRAEGTLRASMGEYALQSLEVTAFEAQLPAAYTSYVQPFLIGTPLDALETAGRLSGSLAADTAGLAWLRLDGRGLAVADSRGRFRLDGARLEADWHRDTALEQASVSRLSWDSAGVYRIALGAAELAWRAAGDDLRLVRPARISVLGGELGIETFSGRDLAGTEPRLRMRAGLEPIRLGDLTTSFGWPALGGTLSGEIPELTYRGGRVELDGGLTAHVFDGRLDITRLRLQDPFGARPRVTMNASARGLDLEAMTGAFSFGRIEGRLDANVRDLRMLDWRPVAFDAWLRTPEDDDSRHRISQRAVDNLASLGGGGAGMVSRGFLSFFDDFAYDRIGLGCRLSQGVCRMRGLGPAEDGGYVIVRGRWLPRIDVIGHTREVSWPTLLTQLREATASEGPVVQ